MNRTLVWLRNAVVAVLVLASFALWIPRGYIAFKDKQFDHAIPPHSVQTFHDFLEWQSEIKGCREIEVRGVTYYHVIGPAARTLPSGGALYVFDANGNFIGWSKDVGDIMRNEAVFYPNWWLPEGSSMKVMSIDELKERLSSRSTERPDEEP